MLPIIENRLKTLDAELILLLKKLNKFSDQDLNYKPDGKSWSIVQVMYHLMISEGLSLRYIKKKLSFQPELKKAGVMAGFRSIALRAYLKSPLKFKAPVGVGGDSIPETISFWEVVKEWKEQRQEMRDFLNTLPEDVLKSELYKHPAAGKISIKEMLRFFKIHFKRHEKQIDKLLKNFNY